MDKTVRVVILGGGFGGLYTTLNLRRLLPRKISAEVTILAEENFFLFTPMLPEVITGEVDSRHILVAIRSFLKDKRFKFHQTAATEIDFEKKLVTAVCEKGHCLYIPYDYLVIAVGSKTNPPKSIDQNGERGVFTLKTVSDALILHNQIIDMFEHAEMLEKEDLRRKQMLTFVIVGGGFAGIEMAASLHDMIFFTLLRQYPGVGEDEIRVVIAHAEDRILPELGEDLALYGSRFLSQRKIEIRLNTLAFLMSEGIVKIGEDNVFTRTLIWTAGAASKTLVQKLPVSKDKSGRVIIDEYARVLPQADVFALGDCAHQKNPITKQTYPPTAQVAIKQARVVAKNIVANVTNAPLSPFVFSSAGMVVPLGHRAAVAIIRGVKMHGFLAWLLSRSLYLLRLPTWSNKIRVALDWILDLFLPKDTTRITLR